MIHVVPPWFMSFQHRATRMAERNDATRLKSEISQIQAIRF